MSSKQQILLNKIEYLFKFFYLLGIVIVLAMLDEVGKDYIIASFMVFMLIYLFCGLSLPQAFYNLVKPRFQKQQFRNAKTVFHSTLLYCVVIETLAIFMAAAFVDQLSAFLHTAKALPYGISLFLPLILLVPVNEIFRTYYQSYNRTLTIIISRALGLLTAVIVGLCVFNPLSEYGQKVDQLLKSDCMGNLYASLTIPIAVLSSQIIVCLYLAWMYLVYKPYIRKQITNDLNKYEETIFTTLPMVSRAHAAANLYKISIYLLVFAAFIFCSFYNRKTAGLTNANTSFGVLAVVICVTIIVPYFVSKAFSFKYVIRHRKMLKNEDTRGIKAYLWNRTHKFFMITFALTVFFIVMAENVIFILTGTVMKQYVMNMRIMALAFSLVPLYLIYNMFLSNMGKSRALLIINYLSLVVSIALTFLLYKIPAVGGYGISIGVITYFVIAFILEFILLEREWGFNRNFRQLLIMPLLSSLVMGIILLLLTKAIGIVEHRIVALLILLGLLLVCGLMYMVLLLVLRCVDEEELNGGFWGRIIYKLGELLRIF